MHMRTFFRVKTLAGIAATGVAAVLIVAASLGNVFGDRVDVILQEVAKIENQAQPFAVEVKIKEGKSSFGEKEHVTFVVRSDRDCYLMLIDVGTSGIASVLFPNEWHKSHFVEAGKEYMIPPENSDFVFEVSGPYGMETIKAIASIEPLDSVEKAEKKQAGPFEQLDNPVTVFKDIATKLKERSTKQWSTATLTFEVRAAQ